MAIERHEITINGRTAAIKLQDVYDNDSHKIGGTLGIQKLKDDDVYSAGTFPITVSGGLKAGLLIQLQIRYKPPGTNSRSRSSKIICPIDRAVDAVNDLIGKAYNGGRISSVSVPQRRRLT